MIIDSEVTHLIVSFALSFDIQRRVIDGSIVVNSSEYFNCSMRDNKKFTFPAEICFRIFFPKM